MFIQAEVQILLQCLYKLKCKYYFNAEVQILLQVLEIFFSIFLFLNFSINNFFLIQIIKMMNKNLCIVNKIKIFMNKYFFFSLFFFLTM